MNIAVDLRSLHTSEFSGVESYTVNLLEHLLSQDRENSYSLFYNAFRPKRFEYLHFINAKFNQTRFPNRLLNVLMKISGKPKIETLMGDADVLFMPNWNLVRLQPKTKLILTVHDLSPVLMPEMYNLKARIWHWFINIPKLVKRANYIVAVSQHTKEALMESLNVPSEKIISVPLGVDHDLFHANLDVDGLRATRNKYGLPGDFMLFVGTIEPRKNLYNIISAFNKLEDNTHLVIAGKWGWKYQNVLKLIEASPKKRLIKLLGYVPEADKPYIMKLAKVFVWPSLYEGFGLPVLEAMAVGTPVLTSQVSSIPEVTADSALLVNPHSTEDISSGMKILLENETLRERYKAKGLERAKQFTWDKTAEQVAQLIDSI